MAGNRDVRRHVQDNLSSFPLLENGTLGRVYLATGPKGEKYSLKISSLSDATEREERYMVTETTNLNRLHHPHVVQYKDCWEERDPQGKLKVHLLMEYCGGGDLLSYVKNHGTPDTQQFGTWLAHVSSGLQYIHAMGILHRNIKTSNIMVSDQMGHIVLKIGDFAMSKLIERPDAMVCSIVGTPYFMSPEIMRGIPYSKKSDIWSLGCTAFEMATAGNIFETKTVKTLRRGLQAGTEKEVRDNIHHGRFFVELIIQMMKENAEERPCADDVVKKLRNQGYMSEDPDFSTPAASRESKKNSRKSSKDLKREFEKLPAVPEQQQVTNLHATVPFLTRDIQGRPLSKTYSHRQGAIRKNTDIDTQKNRLGDARRKIKNSISGREDGIVRNSREGSPGNRDRRFEDMERVRFRRSYSESDVDVSPALNHLTKFLRDKENTSALGHAGKGTDTGSCATGLSTTNDSSSGYETDESGNCLSSIASSSLCSRAEEPEVEDMSIVNQFESLDVEARDDRTSPCESDEDESADRNLKLHLIPKIQRIIMKTIGDQFVMLAAYSALEITDGDKMLEELASILGDKYGDVIDHLIYVRRLEFQLYAIEASMRTLRGGRLNQTI